MPKSEKDTPEGLRALLAREHRELDQLFEALLNALQADARDDALRLWSAFDDGLCRHMALEEKHLLPLLEQQDAREVEGLLKEHEDIRAKLAELGVGVDLHEIRVQTVSDFVEQLRLHARREDALAYRWAQQNVPAAQQTEIRSALDAARALRQRVMEVGRKAKAHVASTR
jgi:hemerythrin-like domain-containing protein